MRPTSDRRKARSQEIFQALGYQLRACREDANLDAIVLSDEHGLCLAASGPRRTCDEVAAKLPIIGRKAGDFQGVLLTPEGGLLAMLQRFFVDDSELYLCAIGGDENLRARQVARSISGVARILSAA